MFDRKENRHYIGAMIALNIFSATFLIMPISNYIWYEYAKIFSFITGLIFWGSGIIGHYFWFAIYRDEKSENKAHRKRKLFLNPLTTIAGILFIIGFVIFAILIVAEQTQRYLMYVSIFMMITSFHAHWLFSTDFIVKIRKTK